ncbi:MAG: lipoyl(octanoyl) transferase LipB [Rikenellaceae bacterium]
MIVKDCGLIEYGTAWDLQKEIFEKVQQGDQQTILLCEHPHVYTLGKSGNRENLLIGQKKLEEIGATYYKSDRGGDITYHGQGQLVVYPIIDLTGQNISLREYIYRLEETVINTIKCWGVCGERSEGATGVWIEGRRKICAIGVRASRSVTMHGLALNVSTQLEYFDYINPCGFTDRGVTSLVKEIKDEEKRSERELYESVKSELINQMRKQFKF